MHIFDSSGKQVIKNEHCNLLRILEKNEFIALFIVYVIFNPVTISFISIEDSIMAFESVALIILDRIFLYYLFISTNESKGIAKIQLIKSFFMNFPLVFSNNELKSTQKPKEINKCQKSSFSRGSVLMGRILISMIFAFLAILNLIEMTQHINAIELKTKFVKITKKESHIFNDLSIWSVGFGCEKENVENERSYSGNNINISDCFF